MIFVFFFLTFYKSSTMKLKNYNINDYGNVFVFKFHLLHSKWKDWGLSFFSRVFVSINAENIIILWANHNSYGKYISKLQYWTWKKSVENNMWISHFHTRPHAVCIFWHFHLIFRWQLTTDSSLLGMPPKDECSDHSPRARVWCFPVLFPRIH